MDKSWMKLNRLDDRYLQGVAEFIELACKDLRDGALEIICPCKICRNVTLQNKEVVKEHLVLKGFTPSYTCFFLHGERTSTYDHVFESDAQVDSGRRDNMQEMCRDAFGIYPQIRTHDMGATTSQPGAVEGADEETNNFFRLLKESERKMYPNCENYSLLSFVVRLMHIKCLSGWSNKSFTLVLMLFKDALPTGEILPNSFDGCKKLLKGLGLDYYKVHACPKDCMLYWGENAEREDWKVCQRLRYKQFEQEENGPTIHRVQIPHKVVRYFPLIPKLKRLFGSSKTSSFMTWHAENPTPDGLLRHLVDSETWKHFDNLYPDFACEPRNVRLGLASDGFNPFGAMNISHSTWPVVLMTYNLPPWLCMKQPYMMLSLLIDGPKAPGNNIDVYLSLVVDELKELWDKGVDTYDALKNEMFKMRAILLWTIHDFLAYANLSGWSTKGYFACPCCHVNTRSRRLVHGKKLFYMGHHRWLDEEHAFRYDDTQFDGTTEFDTCPTRLSGPELLAMFPPDYENKFGDSKAYKDSNARKKRKTCEGADHDEGGNTKSLYNWRKRSIFFGLPYWKDNLIRNNLVVMHIEKNVCDNVLWTIMNDKKGKDNENDRRDLEEMGIQPELHPVDEGGSRPSCLKAPFCMDKKGKFLFLNLLKKLKVPDGYASNISQCVNVEQKTIFGLKSHDNHILLEQLLLIAIRRTLSESVSKPLIELCNFFRLLCSKVLKIGDLDRLQSRIALTLCHLERIFPPTFFDIMVHLPIHLAEEAKLGGPVQYRGMFFVDWYLKTLKGYVRNQARPEGSIAEGYFIEECMTFCSRYLEDTESKLNRPVRNQDGVDNDGKVSGRPLGKEERFFLNKNQKAQAHRYICLFNKDAVTPYREKHREFLRQGNHRIRDRELDRLHHQTFPIWFQKHVHTLQVQSSQQVSEEIADLALGPRDTAIRFSGYFLNGVRYHTRERELRRKTQNSGVMLKESTSSYASARDTNPREGEVTYYGRVTDIIEIYYRHKHKYVLFGCSWIDNNRGLREEDEFGFILVNFNRLLYTREHVMNEPFILAMQAQQVFYVQDPVEEDWCVVIQVKPRDLYEFLDEKRIEDGIMEDFEVDGIGQQQLDEML